MKNILRTSVFMIAVITIFLNINIGMENQNSGNLFNNVENLAYGEHNNSNNFQGPSTSYKITSTTTTTTTSERTGYDCPRQNSSNCNPFRPC